MQCAKLVLLSVAVALLTTMVRGQTCPAGHDCSSPADTKTQPVFEAAATSKQSRKEQQLAALNAEIAEMTKLVSASRNNLKLLERKRRLLFPNDELPPAPAGDDFVPSFRPLVKDLPVIAPPNRLQAMVLLPTPLVNPPKGSRAADKLLGACLITASQDSSLGFYDALGQPVKETDLGNEGSNPVTGLAAASTGKHGLVGVGFQNGSVSLFEVVALKKMDFKIFHMWRESNQTTLPGTTIPATQPAITSVTVHLSSKVTVVYAGDAAGNVQVHTNKIGHLTTVPTLNVTRNQSQPVGVVECCAVKQVVVGVGKTLAFLDSRNLQLSKCFDTDGIISSVAVSSNSMLFATAGKYLLTLKISPNVHRGRRLPDQSFCSILYTRMLDDGVAHKLFLIKNYILLQSGAQDQVTLYNASRLREVGPWPVLPLAIKAAPAPWVVATDGEASFVVGEAGGRNMSIWHTELPQPHVNPGWEMPGRPVVVMAALLLVFGWKYFGRSKPTEEKDKKFPEEFGGASKRGGSRYSRGGGRGGSKGDEMAAMEERINKLGKTTADLGNLMGSVKGITAKAPLNRHKALHPVKRDIMASDY